MKIEVASGLLTHLFFWSNIGTFVQGGIAQMLVIGRKPGEYVMLDDDIMVKVVKSEDGHLRLAIDAPKDVKITRGELYEDQNNERITK
ncbi:carbon storage regulator [Pontibacillus yanchengensis]|nr:carbon storage regulator [Pontibacillus yanchengensis]